MVMPLLSVTSIGVIVAIAFVVARHMAWLGTMARGVAGAWVGFVGGALLGLIADSTVNAGGALAVVGHYGAIAGAVATVARRS